MVHFTNLKANIKAATSIDLEPCTCITGSNTVGKSSILDTIRLALTGKHPIGAHPSDLAQLATEPDPDKIFAALSGPQGSVGWVMSFEEGKPKKPKSPRKTGVFETFSDAALQQSLVLDHRSTLSFGAERMRRAVMSRFGELESIKAPRGLNPGQQAVWDTAVEKTIGSEPSDQLVAMEKHFKTTARVLGDQAKSKETLINSLRAQIVDTAGPELIQQLQARIDKLERVQAQRDNIEHASRLKSEISDLEQQLAGLPSIDTSELDQDIKTLQQSISIAESLLILLGRAQSPSCPCCGSADFDSKAMAETVSARLETRKGEIQELNNRRRRDPREAIEKKITQLQSELSFLKVPDDLDASGDVAELPKLKQQILTLRHADMNRKNLATEEANLLQILDDQATTKLLGQQTSQMLRSYLQTVQVKAEEAVNKFMPEGFRATLHLADNACEWKMVGADGRPHSAGAYSGSEGGSLLIAMAQAWAEGAPYRIVLLDDVDLGVFDRANLQSVFTKFKESVEAGHLDQVVLVWNRPDEVPPDWHKISL